MRKDPKSSGRQVDPQDGPGSWGEALVGMGPFLLYPVIYLLVAPVLEALAAHFDPPESTRAVTVSVWVLILAGPFLAALVFGWVRGFPRWSFPYWGMALSVSGFLVRAVTPGLWIFGRSIGRGDLWGCRTRRRSQAAPGDTPSA